jgi:hypothetical protein
MGAMKLKILRTSAILALSLAIAGPAMAQCDSSETVTLFGGQTIDTGTVKISNDASNLYVTYTTTGPWMIGAIHLAVADSLAAIPQNKNLNPIPGHFAYQTNFNPSVTSFTFTIPLAGFYPGEALYIGAQAEVTGGGSSGGSQTAWGDGPSFGGHNWATYIQYTVQSCIPHE